MADTPSLSSRTTAAFFTSPIESSKSKTVTSSTVHQESTDEDLHEPLAVDRADRGARCDDCRDHKNGDIPAGEHSAGTRYGAGRSGGTTTGRRGRRATRSTTGR